MVATITSTFPDDSGGYPVALGFLDDRVAVGCRVVGFEVAGVVDFGAFVAKRAIFHCCVVRVGRNPARRSFVVHSRRMWSGNVTADCPRISIIGSWRTWASSRRCSLAVQ